METDEPDADHESWEYHHCRLCAEGKLSRPEPADIELTLNNPTLRPCGTQVETNEHRRLYDSLPLGDKEFRLLKVAAIEEIGSPLICYLIKHRLPVKDVAYIAVSYT